jgi:hypothetical protein
VARTAAGGVGAAGSPLPNLTSTKASTASITTTPPATSATGKPCRCSGALGMSGIFGAGRRRDDSSAGSGASADADPSSSARIGANGSAPSPAKPSGSESRDAARYGSAGAPGLVTGRAPDGSANRST